MDKHAWALTVAGVLLAGTAFGHARLLRSSPTDRAHLPVAPKSLTLTFNENVQLAVLSLTSDGKDMPLNVDRSATAAREVTVMLPPMADGRYQVQWSALSSDDGHVSKGTFSFIVGTAAPAATVR